jgi:hypothetical protein
MPSEALQFTHLSNILKYISFQPNACAHCGGAKGVDGENACKGCGAPKVTGKTSYLP